MRELAERANFLLSSDRVVLFGLSTVIRRALHEGPLSGNEPNFAKVAICALLPFVQVRTSRQLSVYSMWGIMWGKSEIIIFYK